MKRAQVSIFVIIGIVILILGFAFIFFLRSPIEVDTPTQVTTPLEQFVRSCIEKTSKSGLIILGSQGGYIEVPENIRQNPTKSVSATPDRVLVTPFWIEFGQDRSPSMSRVETEFAQYISENIGGCLGNFSETAIGASAIGNPQATVFMSQNDVTITLDYEVELASARGTVTVDQFIYKLPLNLQSILDSAKQFSQTVYQNDFFDLLTIDLMAISDPDIPMTGIDISCSPLRWSEREVENQLIEVLQTNIPRVQVKGAELSGFTQEDSAYERFRDIEPDDFLSGDPSKNAPEDIYEYMHMYIDDGNSELYEDSKVKIGFSFDPTGLQFTVRPSQNGIMKPSSSTGNIDYLRFLCLQSYHFTYDVIYPVVVNYVVNDVFGDGTPFVLRFAVPVQINSNLPDDSEFVPSLTLPDQYSADLCERQSDTPTAVYVRDKATGDFLANADVQYHCVRFACPLGTTSQSRDRAFLNAYFPQGCTYAHVYAQKDGYVPSRTLIESTDAIEVELLPLETKRMRVVLGSTTTIPTALTDDQYAIIMLEDYFSDYESFNTYDLDIDLNTIDFIKGSTEYKMTVLVYEQSDLIGGFIGNLTVEQSDLQNSLFTIHAYETRLNPTIVDESDAWFFLEDDVVYKPVHGGKWE